jgi:hypothetical protein
LSASFFVNQERTQGGHVEKKWDIDAMLGQNTKLRKKLYIN